MIIFQNVFSRFQEPKEHHDDRTETMLKIYEDSTMTKESQDRYGLLLSTTVVFVNIKPYVKQHLTKSKRFVVAQYI